jgi:hypothetical protein
MSNGTSDWTAAGRAHYKLASGAMFFTVGTAYLGMANTFLRTGRLFPGPHLYRGLLFILVIALNGKHANPCSLLYWRTAHKCHRADRSTYPGFATQYLLFPT